MLGGQIVHTAPGQSMLRHRYWRTIRITHSRALGGLRFEIDGTHLLDDVPIDVSAMAVTPTWRFGFGARTGPNPTQAEERHDIKNFHATNGAAARRHTPSLNRIAGEQNKYAETSEMQNMDN